jgi:Lysine-specific metallo-endopeptidase
MARVFPGHPRTSGLVSIALVLLVVAPGTHAGVSVPAEMPATPMPDFKGCSNSQREFLRKAWRRAHYFTWRADGLLQHIQARPADERLALWNRDFTDSVLSSAVKRWFGAHDKERADFVAEAVHKAEKRFRMQGEVVKGIRTLRCGSPIAPAPDEHIDVCPGQNPGSDGPPSAYHAPVGTIVLCPVAWTQAPGLSDEDHLSLGARRLVHEVFHWLSVDGKYVVDRHGDGVGGEKDTKYYGTDNATYLAQHKPSWAIRNNDNYASFALAVGLAEPTYTAVFIPKESPGTGALFAGMSWDQLVANWKTLGAQQYLAEVETYVVAGKRQFLGVWRMGPGNGALYLHDWTNFAKTFAELKGTQDLIDVEAFETEAGRRFLGVWRAKPDGQKGDGGLLVGLSWSELTAKWQELGAAAYLAGVETYVDNGSRKYIGVWRVGGGPSALFQYDDWHAFAKTADGLKSSQQLINVKRYQDAEGRHHVIGVWRGHGTSGALQHGLTFDQLVDKWKSLAGSQTLIDVEVIVPLAAEVR